MLLDVAQSQCSVGQCSNLVQTFPNTAVYSVNCSLKAHHLVLLSTLWHKCTSFFRLNQHYDDDSSSHAVNSSTVNETKVIVKTFECPEEKKNRHFLTSDVRVTLQSTHIVTSVLKKNGGCLATVVLWAGGLIVEPIIRGLSKPSLCCLIKASPAVQQQQFLLLTAVIDTFSRSP